MVAHRGGARGPDGSFAGRFGSRDLVRGAVGSDDLYRLILGTAGDGMKTVRPSSSAPPVGPLELGTSPLPRKTIAPTRARPRVRGWWWVDRKGMSGHAHAEGGSQRRTQHGCSGCWLAAPAAATAVRPNVFVYYLDDLRDAFPGGCQHGLRVIEPLPATCGARSFGRRLPGHLQRVVEADRLLHESSDERPCRGAPRR